MRTADLRIIVTGAASGMGAHFARRLVEQDARVLAVDLNAEGLAKLKAKYPSGALETFCADVSCEEAVAGLILKAVDCFGSVNGLINNAGLFRDGLLVKKDRESGSVKSMSLADWQRVIDVDLTGPFLCTRAVAAHMVERQISPGVIVNVSSISRYGNFGQSNYSAAKAGLVADTRVWAKELARYGIRVGAVAPGFVDTPILRGMRPEVLTKMLETIALKRAAEPEEIYLGVRFIVECDYFTGRCIDLDGGTSI